MTGQCLRTKPPKPAGKLLRSFQRNAGLVLKIFLALLPMLLTFMNKRAGMQSLAEIDYGVFVKYFIFQVRLLCGHFVARPSAVQAVPHITRSPPQAKALQLRWSDSAGCLKNPQSIVHLHLSRTTTLQQPPAQVISVFFGTFIVGSFFSQFNQWIDNPSSAINLIGTAVPQVCTPLIVSVPLPATLPATPSAQVAPKSRLRATAAATSFHSCAVWYRPLNQTDGLCAQTASFFLTYMALSALWTTPFSGLNVIGLVIYWIKSKIAATEKARARLWQEQHAKYGAAVSFHPHRF